CYTDSRYRLRGISQEIGVTQRQYKHQQNRDNRQTSFDWSPPRRRFICRRSKSEPNKTYQADSLRYGTRQILRKQSDRIVLEERVILWRLTRIEPDDVKKKSPSHNSRPCPHQPGGGQNNEHRCKLIKKQNRAHPPAGWSLLCDDVDYSRRSVGSGSQHEFGAAFIGDEAKTSQGRHRTCTSESVYGNAPHLIEIEPVAGTQASLKRGGVHLC